MCIYTGICFTATIYVNTPDQDGIRLVPPVRKLLKCSAETLAIFDKVCVCERERERERERALLGTTVHNIESRTFITSRCTYVLYFTTGK